MIPKLVFSDFDGTLTNHSEFSPLFFDILDLLKEKKRPFVIVTGRSASWAHFFLSHFSSIEYVISEGGGVLSRRTKKGFIKDEIQIEDQALRHLAGISKSLQKKFPKLELTADSVGRITDCAIELALLESDFELRKKVEEYLEREKINFSTSNVHMNFWSGEVSKYKAMQVFLGKYYPDISMDECLFFGDSLNDQSVFKNLQHTVGVSNINSVIKHLEYRPTEILSGEENAGPNGVLNYLRGIWK